MKSLPLLSCAAVSCLVHIASGGPPPWHFEFSGGLPNKLVWQTTADRYYDLFFSSDLGGWGHVDGFPKAGVGTIMEHPFVAGGQGFFRIVADDGFALIPAGQFQMGDQSPVPRLGASGELPVHAVYVSAFHMAKFEVTVELWDMVRDAAVAIGYTDLGIRDGKPGHPVISPDFFNWTSVVKWCNAYSEIAGLTPCYTVAGSVFKTGDGGVNSVDVACNFGANGYRLPTEAEWEKAARGGLAGRNFPLADTISQTEANYKSGNYSYESPKNVGYHPVYLDGFQPYTAPPARFAANGYGLFDMAGNVEEWCWDRYGTYPATAQTDPHGPDSGSSNRVIRGGCWFKGAHMCRVSARWSARPDLYLSSETGFRLARSVVP